MRTKALGRKDILARLEAGDTLSYYQDGLNIVYYFFSDHASCRSDSIWKLEEEGTVEAIAKFPGGKIVLKGNRNDKKS